MPASADPPPEGPPDDPESVPPKPAAESAAPSREGPPDDEQSVPSKPVDEAAFVERWVAALHHAIDATVERFRPRLNSAAALAGRTTRSVRAEWDAAKTTEREMLEQSRDWIRTHPLAAVALAFGVGMLAARGARRPDR